MYEKQLYRLASVEHKHMEVAHDCDRKSNIGVSSFVTSGSQTQPQHNYWLLRFKDNVAALREIDPCSNPIRVRRGTLVAAL
jgi:hypothetical protein